MPSRRSVLAAVASGSVALAGCECLSDPAYSLSHELENIKHWDGAWEMTVTSTARFTDIDDGQMGVRGLSLATYSPTSIVLAEETIGELLWEDVPDENREEDDCRSRGQVGKRTTIELSNPPFYIGPRIDHDRTLEYLEYSIHSLPIEALEYDGPVNEWPPETVEPDDYRTVSVSSLPYPARDDILGTLTHELSALRFVVTDDCADGRRVHPRIDVVSERPNDYLTIRWSCPTPDTGATRPLLESIELVDDELEVRIGRYDPPWEPDLNCDDRPYNLYVTPSRVEADSITRVTLNHVDASGTTVERVSVQRVGD